MRRIRELIRAVTKAHPEDRFFEGFAESCRMDEALRELTSVLLPPHSLIHHQRHLLELHNGLGRDGFALGDIEVKAVVQRDDH